MEIDELRRLSAKEELSLNYIAKDEKISEILLKLQDIEKIILKGGTAINRVYLKTKRFSEDIDFDIIVNGNLKQALAKTKEIVDTIKGFNIEMARIMNQTIRYDLTYTNLLQHKDKIRLEFRHLKKANTYSKKVVNFGYVPYDSALLNVYELEELIIHKLNCIINRKEGKDFFDLYYLLDLPHKRIKFSKDKIIERLNLDDKEIKAISNVINHYIPKDKRPDWSLFLEELKEKIKRY